MLSSQHLVLTAWSGLRGVGRGALTLTREMLEGLQSAGAHVLVGVGDSATDRPQAQEQKTTHLMGATANNLLKFLISFLGSRVRREAARTTFLRWSIFLLHGTSELESAVGV